MDGRRRRPHLLENAGSPDLWGVLIEMGYSEGLVTLLVLADGTTSL